VIRLVLLCAGVVTAGVLLFTRGRRQARDPARSRAGLILRYGIGTLLGVYLGLVLPRSVPDTPGSPAALVITLLLWIVGGGVGFASLAALLGVLSAPRVER
jgi:hypothetical protein